MMSATGPPLATPDWPLEDTSFNFFLSQFVVGSNRTLSYGWYDFVPDILTAGDSSASFDYALRAVSLLAVASRHRRQDLLVKAIRANGRALVAVNTALASAIDATNDSVFAAILLLCLFGVSWRKKP